MRKYSGTHECLVKAVASIILVNIGSSMNKRKDNSFGPILGQYYLDRHSISNTNILKITGLVKHCPIFH